MSDWELVELYCDEMGGIDENDLMIEVRGNKAERENLIYHLLQRTKHAKGGSLKGNQSKLDLNKNGKLDSEDFKMIRGEMKNGGGVGQVKAKAWIINEEGGLPKIKAYKTIMEAHNNVYKQGGHQINSLSRLKDFLSAKYDINNVEPYMYVKQMANGGGLADVPESFPETDAMSYGEGGNLIGKQKMKNLKSYEIITPNGKSHFVSAFSKKSVENFWLSSPIKKLIERKDIDASTNMNIENKDRKMANGGSTKGFEYSIGGL